MSAYSTLLIGDEALMAECGAQLLARGHPVVAVVTDNPRMIDWAEAHGLRVVAPGAGLAARLEGLRFDWLLNIAGLRLLQPELLALPTRGAVNFHDGPLPHHAGLHAPVRALLEGETRHGITWHLMDEGVNSGDILLQRAYDITPEDTALTLNAKSFEAGVDSFGLLLDMLGNEPLQSRPQTPAARRPFRRDDRPAHAGHIDPARPASDGARLVRALTFGPYWNPLTTPKLMLGEQVIVVGAAHVVEKSGPAGRVLAVDAESVTLACAEGALVCTGLLCQQGLPVAPDTLVRAGETVTLPDAACLGALLALAQGENGWRDALRAMQPSSWQGGRAESAVALEFADTGPADRILAVAQAIAPRMGLRKFAMAYQNATIAAHHRAAPAHVAEWVPLQVDLDAPEPHAAITAQLDRAGRIPGFARELAARDPRLGPVTPPPVAICDGAEASEAALVLDLAAGCLRYDPGTLADADALAAQIAAATQQDTPLPAPAPIDTATPYTRQCIHHAFAAQVRRTPDAIALSHEAQSLSYAELNARANRVAHLLISLGITPDTPVALCTRRGPNMLIGALGILKAGGAYVPMDPAYPEARLAHFLTDSGAPVLVTETGLTDSLPAERAQRVLLDTDARLGAQPGTDPETQVTPDHLAYLIYTSGSTGLPKGVMVEHGNVANFFAGMDAHIRHDPPGVWLAVTSLSFDISVLELFWTLARGFKVVLMGDAERAPIANAPIRRSETGMEFSLMYWGNDDGAGPQKYRLLLEGAKFADSHGFCAVWTPERHFHAFGGPFPNPAVSGAAVAAVTRNIAVRAGSCVVPLHHPIRIAEEWAVIDNLTGGRTGIGIASGWHPVDFILRPENRPPNNKAAMFDTLDTVRRLWRGEVVEFDKGDGMVPVQTLPRPVSKELNIWLTTAGNPETWREAGRLGAHVLTHLLGQSITEVGEKIAIYHDALRGAGHDPADFTVTLMLHSFVARDRDHAREGARGPMKSYLKAAAALVKQYAWAFPAFKRPAGAKTPMDIDLSTLSEDEVEGILDYAFNRYFEDSGLFGTVEDCLTRVDQLKAIGVTEVACLIDYGIATEQVLEGLYPLAEVVGRAGPGLHLAEDDYSLAAQIHRHEVTHLQCTPSMARMLMLDDDARAALARVPNILLGGEALPGPLAAEIAALTGQPVQNMYGPTETTIWSSTTHSQGGPGVVGIGQPIANTQLHVLDECLTPCAVGQEGELLIGGDGVTRGYWKRPELTAERFLPDPAGTGRLYRTGDLVRRNPAGGIDFLGRVDHQVKIRGHRVELGEIEAVLQAQPGIAQAVVTAREDQPGDVRLVAYYTGTPQDDLRAALARVLPAHHRPAHLVPLAAMPLTPNRKIDRNALPAPTVADRPEAPAPTAGPVGDTQATITQIWCDVLGVPQVGASDNFFDLGGHSLLAVQAHRAIRAALDLPGLSITDVFRFPVLGDLARHLDRQVRPPPQAEVTPLHPPASGAAVETRAPESRSSIMARRRAARAQKMRS